MKKSKIATQYPHFIVDRREVAKKRSSGNRQRFLRRIKNSIRKQALNIVGKGLQDTKKSEDVTIDSSTIDEPHFLYDDVLFHGPIVLPGNFRYVKGDLFDLEEDRFQQNIGEGEGAGSGEDGEDDFIVNVSKDEFYNYFFEGLELPNLEKKQDTKIVEVVNEHAGFVNVGPPSHMNILRTLSFSKKRRIALGTKWKRRIEEIEELLKTERDDKKVIELTEELAFCKAKLRKVAFLDNIDLQYRITQPTPIKKSTAVIFFLMDNSGSMTETYKTNARKFFAMFYAFVNRKYESPDIVFISHTDIAKEVDEDYFFNTRDNGGTQVSAAYRLALDIIKERYNANETNIYLAHATDGDNAMYDNDNAIGLMKNILALSQFAIYIEVGAGEHPSGGGSSHSLWSMFGKALFSKTNFAMKYLNSADRIYSIFTELFAPRGK